MDMRTLEGQDGRAAVQIPVIVVEQAAENVRCIRLASGRLVYEFWTGRNKRAVRIDADVYDSALEHARAHPQDDDDAL